MTFMTWANVTENKRKKSANHGFQVETLNGWSPVFTSRISISLSSFSHSTTFGFTLITLVDRR